MIATALGFGLRLYKLGHARLWLDEYATYAFARSPLARLWGPDIAAETNPPLYYTLQHFWLPLGDSPFVLRTLPVLFGTVCVPLAYLLARRLLGPRIGLLTAFLVATSPILVHFSRQVRGYTLLTMAVLGALLCLSYLLPSRFLAERGAAAEEDGGGREPSGRLRRLALWSGYFLATTIALYTHNTAVLFPVLGTGLVFGLWTARRLDSRWVIGWVLVNAAVLLAFSWWLPNLLQQTRTTLNDFWIPPSTWTWVKSQLMGVYHYDRWLKPVMYAIPLVGVWVLRRRRGSLGVLLTFLVGQPLVMYLLSLYRPIFIVRALVWPSVFYFMLVAAALAAIPRRRWRVAAAVGVLLIQVATVLPEYPAEREDSALVPLARRLAAFDPDRDAVLFAPLDFEWEYEYHAREKAFPLPGFGVRYGDAPLQLEAWHRLQFIDRRDVRERIGAFDRVWLLLEREPQCRIPAGGGFAGVLEALGAVAVERERRRSGNFDLILYEVRRP